MIWRKLSLLGSGHYAIREKMLFEIPFVEETKQLTVQTVKKYGHLGVVEMLRLYIRSTNLLKNKSEEIKNKIINALETNTNLNNEGKGENKFLKMMSDYKYKIRKIKRKIIEEEKLKN